MGDALICGIKTADSDTNSIFFGESSKIEDYFNNRYDKDNFPKYLEALSEFSAMYVCTVLSSVTDYSFHDMVITVTDEKMTDWLEKNKAVGEGILFQEIYNRLKDEWNEEETASRIREQLLENDGLKLYGLITENEIEAVKLLLIVLKKTDTKAGQKELNQVLDFIKSSEVLSKYGLERFSDTPWLLRIKADFMRSSDYHDSIKTNLLTACRKEKVTGDEYGIHYLKTKGQVGLVMLHKTYGEAVESWVDKTASKYHLNSGKRPQNTKDERAKEENLFGCVAAGTGILMEDGSVKNIEALIEGDAVRNAAGGISLCSREKVVNKNVDFLYSINDDLPFMSLDHAVLTTTGWRCPRPDLAKKINGHYPIGILGVGDVVVKADPADGHLINAEVKKINVAANTLPCYDLHFSDGYHSYIANNYCTLLNYPEITAATTVKKLNKSQLSQMEPVIKETFGNKNIDFDSEYADGVEYETERLKKGISMVDLCLPDMKIVYPGGGKTVGQNQTPSPVFGEYKNFSLFKGYAMFDRQEPVEIVYEDNKIYWKREVVENGATVTEEGIGRFLFDRLAIQLKLVRNGNEQVLYALPDFSYQIQYKKKEDTKAEDFAVFHMRYELDSKGNPYTVGEIRMLGISDPISENCLYSSKYMKEAGGTVLCVKADILDLVCGMGASKIKTLDFHFDLLFENISGTGIPFEEENEEEETEEGKPGEEEETEDKNYIIQGSLIKSQAFHELKRRVTDHALRSRVQPGHFLSGKQNRLQGKAILRISDEELSVAALCSIPELHDLDQLHNECFAAVRNMAMYVMTDEELNMCGETRPVKGDASGFTKMEADLAEEEENKKFLQEQFTAGYFSTMFANCSGDGYEKIVEKFEKYTDPKETLGYFWKGTETGCFCRYDQYRAISQKVYDEIYMAHMPDLKPYMKDKGTREYWAKELYEYLTNKANPLLLGLITTYMNGGSERIEHLCAMLRMLDDKTQVSITTTETSTYAQALKYFTMNALLQQMASGYKGGQVYIPETECQKFIESFIRDLIDAIINKKPPYDEKTWDASIRTELMSEINSLMEALKLESRQSAIDTLIGTLTSGVSILFAVKNLDIAAVMPKVDDFMVKHNLGSTICKTIILVGMYATSIYQVVGLYKQFNKMTDLEKAALISQTVGMGYGFFQDAYSIYKSFKEIRLEAQMRMNAAIRDNISEISLIEGNEEGSAAEIMERAGEAQAAEIREVSAGELEKTSWERFCEKGPKVIGNVINIVIMGITTAVCIVDTLRDFKNDESALVKAFDIAEVVGFGLGTLVEITGLFATAGQVGKFIPYVGVAFVVIGLVASLVLAIVGKKEPKREETAVEKYITAKCIPFMDLLPKVPEDWQAVQQIS